MPNVEIAVSPSKRPYKKPKNKKQAQLSVPSANGVALKEVMVSNFMQSNALPESPTGCPLLCVMIEQAYYMPLDYEPPPRQFMGTMIWMLISTQ